MCGILSRTFGNSDPQLYHGAAVAQSSKRRPPTTEVKGSGPSGDGIEHLIVRGKFGQYSAESSEFSPVSHTAKVDEALFRNQRMNTFEFFKHASKTHPILRENRLKFGCNLLPFSKYR